MSPFGFRSLLWLLTYPEASNTSAIKPHASPPEIDLLALLGTAPEDSILGTILSFAGSRIRRLHIEQFSPTIHLLENCTMLTELVIGMNDEWKSPLGLSASLHLSAYPGSSPSLIPPLFSNEIPPPSFTELPRRPLPRAKPRTPMACVPNSVRKLVIFGQMSKLFPLDRKFPDALNLLNGEGLNALQELVFVVDDSPEKNTPTGILACSDQFSHAAIEREWNIIFQRLGIDFSIRFNRVRIPVPTLSSLCKIYLLNHDTFSRGVVHHDSKREKNKIPLLQY